MCCGERNLSFNGVKEAKCLLIYKLLKVTIPVSLHLSKVTTEREGGNALLRYTGAKWQCLVIYSLPNLVPYFQAVQNKVIHLNRCRQSSSWEEKCLEWTVFNGILFNSNPGGSVSWDFRFIILLTVNKGPGIYCPVKMQEAGYP